jgi:CRP/FNR family transcriptional regulator
MIQPISRPAPDRARPQTQASLVERSAIQCRTCPVRENPLCGAARGRSREDLARAGRLRRLAPEQTLLDEGESHLVGVVRRGILRMQRTNRDGRRFVPALAFPGETVGRVFGSGSFACAVEASTEAEICVFEPFALQRILRNDPALARSLMRAVSDWLDRTLHLTWLLMSLRVEDRVGGFLLLLNALAPTRSEDPDRVRVDVPRRDLADHLGTSAETVSRALHALERHGRIEILGSRDFRLRDRKALEEASGLTPETLEGLLGPGGEAAERRSA